MPRKSKKLADEAHVDRMVQWIGRARMVWLDEHIAHLRDCDACSSNKQEVALFLLERAAMVALLTATDPAFCFGRIDMSLPMDHTLRCFLRNNPFDVDKAERENQPTGMTSH